MKKNYEGRLLTKASPFAISEAFKTLRTNLFYTAGGQKCPAYGITSTFANSGKSIIISNLAVSFAQLEKRVLLLDCDLRNSTIHKIFGLERAEGMSELLAGGDTAIDRYIKKTEYPNLSIITSGGTPPNPAELLAGERMGRFLQFVKEHFDVIFIDLPPIGLVSDAAVISNLVVGYLYVVRSRMDDSKSLRYSVSMMEQMQANIIGFVLNDIDLKTSEYYGGKYGRYGRRYGRYSRYGKRYGYDASYGYRYDGYDNPND